MKKLLFIIFLYSCQQLSKPKNDNQTIKKVEKDTISTIEEWCMYQRTGFQGDSIITSTNKLTIEKDSIVIFTIDNTIIYHDTVYKKPDYTYSFLLQRHGFAILKKDNSRKILIHFPHGEDGDVEYYKPCNK